jgi:hypothetical protein
MHMEKQRGYEAGLKNTGAQEVPALRKSSGTKKGKAQRGRDLRSGK